MLKALVEEITDEYCEFIVTGFWCYLVETSFS